MRDDDPLERRRKQRQSRERTRLALVIGAVGLALAVAVVASVVMLWTPRNDGLGAVGIPFVSRSPDMTMTAQEMIDRTAGNPTAMSPHNGKVVRLTGTLHRISGNVHNDTYLYFENHNGKGESPRCFFQNPAELADLKKGDTITIQGEIRALGSGVDIAFCSIIR